jgi:hypothetical protein
VELKYLNFQFLPNVFSSLVSTTYESPVTPTKFKLAIDQTTFIISAGHYFLLIAFYIAWALLISLLKNRSINKYVRFRRFCKETFIKRIRFNACLWFCFMTFVIFGLWQFKDFSTTESWSIMNHALAVLCLLLCLLLVVWNVYLALEYRK